MKALHHWVRQQLESERQKNLHKVNQWRKEKTTFAVNDWVWTEVPKNPLGIVGGNKLDVRWLGPRLVTARVGEHSYMVKQSEHGKEKQFHRDQL